MRKIAYTYIYIQNYFYSLFKEPIYAVSQLQDKRVPLILFWEPTVDCRRLELLASTLQM